MDKILVAEGFVSTVKIFTWHITIDDTSWR